MDIYSLPPLPVPTISTYTCRYCSAVFGGRKEDHFCHVETPQSMDSNIEQTIGDVARGVEVLPPHQPDSTTNSAETRDNRDGWRL